MTSNVKVFVGAEEVSVAALCERMGVSHSKMAKIATLLAAGPENDLSIANFYELWLSGSLPVKPRPCVSRELYRLYCLWCKYNGGRPVTETKLLREVPAPVQKLRKHIRINGVVFLRSMVQPDFFKAPLDEPMTNYLGRENDAFLAELAAMKKEG